MNNAYTIIAVVLVSVFGFTHGASAEFFQCAFLQEKYRSGKPNKASCAMSPEKVYSTKDYTPPKNEHCEVKPVYSYEDLEEVGVDISKGTVSWIQTTGLTEEAKPIQKQYLIKEGTSEEEANKQVNAPAIQKRQTFKIVAHHKSYDKIQIDEITEKFIDQQKLLPQHNLIFSNDFYLFHMYIPESTTEAILLEPDEIMGNSWVRVRFGKCRKLSGRP